MFVDRFDDVSTRVVPTVLNIQPHISIHLICMNILHT